jgi:iron complex transport system ATP-binding protein
MLEVTASSFCYGEKQVLQDVSLSLAKGEILALIGPNGSGKSTLLRCMAGIYSPSKGAIKLDGKELGSYSRRAISKRIAFLPQNLEFISHITVRELVARGRSPHQAMGWMESGEDRQKVDWALAYMNLEEMEDRCLDKLSGGERQRAWIAMIIAQDTEFIFLDEPVNHLDIKYQWGLLKTVDQIRQEMKKSFVLVLHDINHALNIADRVIVLKDGQVYRSGDTKEIVTPHLIKEVYGVCAHVCRFANCSSPVIVPAS